ncbi:MAG: hypothetical protein LBQ05_01620, partial [Christensenellaceae bacterium]|nr:hypothetical protein [Christensenellaceae bacterium]
MKSKFNKKLAIHIAKVNESALKVSHSERHNAFGAMVQMENEKQRSGLLARATKIRAELENADLLKICKLCLTVTELENAVLKNTALANTDLANTETNLQNKTSDTFADTFINTTNTTKIANFPELLSGNDDKDNVKNADTFWDSVKEKISFAKAKAGEIKNEIKKGMAGKLRHFTLVGTLAACLLTTVTTSSVPLPLYFSPDKQGSILP